MKCPRCGGFYTLLDSCINCGYDGETRNPPDSGFRYSKYGYSKPRDMASMREYWRLAQRKHRMKNK